MRVLDLGLAAIGSSSKRGRSVAVSPDTPNSVGFYLSTLTTEIQKEPSQEHTWPFTPS